MPFTSVSSQGVAPWTYALCVSCDTRHTAQTIQGALFERYKAESGKSLPVTPYRLSGKSDMACKAEAMGRDGQRLLRFFISEL